MGTSAVTVKATTQAPHGLDFTFGGNYPAGVTFNLYIGTAAGAEPNTPTVSGVTSPYLWTGGTGGTDYFAYATAVENGIESVPSNEVNAVYPTVPSAPVLSVSVQ